MNNVTAFDMPTLLPDSASQAIALRSLKALEAVPVTPLGEVRLQVEVDGQHTAVIVPNNLLDVVRSVLRQIAKGAAVTVVPVNTDISTQDAADLLGVSRPYFVKLLEEGRIPFHRVGNHRRVRFADLQAFKRKEDAERERALDELVSLAQRSGEYKP